MLKISTSIRQMLMRLSQLESRFCTTFAAKPISRASTDARTVVTRLFAVLALELGITGGESKKFWKALSRLIHACRLQLPLCISMISEGCVQTCKKALLKPCSGKGSLLLEWQEGQA
ncbi:MAG: hypothetical protein IBX50_17605, partial [Marinospirillum sp.]|uniref:hypothetical protein n=1 Tax=Marinospirillum sp. TaxID=2183934 RepID=UPI0019EFD31B